MTDIKVGDIVHVRGTINSIDQDCDPTQYWVLFDGTIDHVIATRAEIVHVEPRQLKIGDRVRPDHCSDDMTIIAISGSFAWLKSHDPSFENNRYTIPLNKLTLAETK